ncbi:MAG: Twitching motility protein PilT, partial [Ignavibacteriaceae bacterium]|nr:Twitching motility protein PilT [Ignavibacteriaceae bacterium]
MTLITELKIKTDNAVINTNTEAVIKKIVSKIPHTLHGPDRISYLMEILPSIQLVEKELLIGLFNSFLSEMVRREASDIEVGGYGSNDFVWFRVYGKKNPIEELPRLNNDEAALLILSILNEKQRKILEQNRNLDFSYTFDYSKVNKLDNNEDISEIRFRGDAYFDVDCLA